MRKLITGFQGRVSEDGEFLDFEFTSEDGERFEFRASTDGIDTIMSSLESLATGAVRKRMDLGTDRGFAPKELPALRSFADGFVVEEAEPGDDFEGYRLLIYRASRPPIMIHLRKERFEEFVKALREAPTTSGLHPKH